MKQIPILRPRIPVLTGRSVAMPAKQRAQQYGTAQHVAWARQVRELACHRCQRCGREGVRLYADHIRELNDGGTWALSNGQALCGSCHTNKTMVERARRARIITT